MSMPSPARRPRRTQEILGAALDLLAERGYDALAIEAVAERAGVNKTTIYRSWSSKDELLADALREADVLKLTIPDTGSLRGDLLAVARQIAELLTTEPTRRLATVLIGLPERPATARAAEAFFADRLGREQVIFRRAWERGELAHGIDPSTVMDLLGGALWFRLLVRSGSADQRYLETLVDTVLHDLTAVPDAH